MSSNLETRINYLTAKRKYEKILREAKVIVEQRWDPGSGPAVKAFVKPFADIFKALKLTAMDIGNSTRLILGTLLAFDSKKLIEKRKAFEERRAMLRAEWKPIIGDSLDAIKNADPLLSFSLMPTAYFAAQGLAAGIKTGATAAEIISGESWERLLEKLWRMPTELDALNAILKLQSEEAGKGNSKGSTIKSKLSRLFFGGETNESVLREQKEKAAKYDTSSEQAWLADFFKDTGLDQAFDEVAADSIKNQLSVQQEVASATQRMLVVAELIGTDSVEDFQEVLKAAVSKNQLDAGDISEFEKIIPQIEQQAKQLANSQDFRVTAAQTQGVDAEKVTDATLADAARKVAFNAGKVSFNEQAIGGAGGLGIANFASEIKKLREETKLDSKTIEQLKKRTNIPEAKQLIEIYENSQQSYDKAQQALTNALGSSQAN